MFTYKKAPYKIFALDPKFCWADPNAMSAKEIHKETQNKML